MSSSKGVTKSKAQSAKESRATKQQETGACKNPSQHDKPSTKSPSKTTEYCSKKYPTTSPSVKHKPQGGPYKDIKSEHGYVPPNRPSYATLGSSLTVIINFFPIKIPNITIHQYDVTIFDSSTGGENDEKTEEQTAEYRRTVSNKYVCRNVINVLSNTQLKSEYPAYDGRSILYLKDRIDVRRYTVEWKDEEDGKRVRQHEVVLKHTAHIDLSVITGLTQREHQFDSMTNHDEFLSRHQVATNAVDTIFKQFAAARYTPSGRGFYWYCKGRDFDLGSELELWKGFTQSARPGQKQAYLNINMSYRPCIKPWYLLDYLWEVLYYLKDFEELCNEAILEDAAKEIFYLELYTDHLGHKRKYKVKRDKVFLQPANKETFLCDGKVVTVQKYFKNHYKKELKYPDLPCIDVGRGDKVIALPMEICYIKEGQRSNNEMTSKQKRKMVETTSVPPINRQDDIKSIAIEMLPPDDPLRNYYKIETSNAMVKAECRQLPPPVINYNKNTSLKPNYGKWQLGGYKLVEPIPVYLWAILHFSNFSKEDGYVRYNAFINQMQRQAGDKGIHMERPVNEKILTEVI
ncbi:hypothetical protein LOD99_7018 [Oopsacas minuta]|uniref:PAZ domain-containing protein n=1 Tax=Oopsacas minuta TaxID=111878 RepID=A0AAV7JJ65_9METZ|nr:hypothetical protein LOD99_7018 [Oopsacas minuta]